MIPSRATALCVLPLAETFSGSFISSSLSLRHLFELFCGPYLPPSIIPIFLYPPTKCTPSTDGLFLGSQLPYIFHAKHIKQDVKLRPSYEKEHVAFAFGGLCNLTKSAVFQFRSFSWQLHNFAFLFCWVILLLLYIPHFHYLLNNWWTSRLFPFMRDCDDAAMNANAEVVEGYCLLACSSWLVQPAFFWSPGPPT